MPVVIFTRIYNGYSAMEQAYYSREEAAELIAKGVAESTSTEDTEDLVALVAAARAKTPAV